MGAKTAIHATCVAVGDVGILLTGPSGSGKSDLALRLITTPWVSLAGWRTSDPAQDRGSRSYGSDSLSTTTHRDDVDGPRERLQLPLEVKLVADDRVWLRSDASSDTPQLLASADDAIAGQIEVRGLGVMHLPFVHVVRVELAVRLAPFGQAIERFPDPLPTVSHLDHRLPEMAVAPFEASAPHKIMMQVLANRAELL